jgi:predicted O-linked N-acetylglucosamine transferase (SPINDLY family)
VPGSRLFLKTKQLGETSVCLRVLSRFATRGIDGERLILEGAAPRYELLAAYRRVDIALDPFPYPGGTTSIEALWLGVPVLTLAGDRFLSHIGVSIMQNAGMAEYIAADAEDYVERAVIHAGDLQRLAKLRSRLRHQVLDSPLFDAPRFARHFGAALRGMWVQWCNQQRGKIS